MMKKETKIKIERIMAAMNAGAKLRKACKLYGLNVEDYQRLKNEYFQEKNAAKLYTCPTITFDPSKEKEEDIVLDDNEELVTTIKEVCPMVEEKKPTRGRKPVEKNESITFEHLEALRIAKGFTSINKMAQFCGVNYSTLRKTPLSEDIINKLCTGLECTEDYIMGLTPVEPRRYNKTLADAEKEKKPEVVNTSLEEEYKAKFNELSDQLIRLRSENETLKNEKITLESKVKEHIAINNGLQKKITELQNKVKEFETQSNIVVPHTPIKVEVLPQVNVSEFEKQKKLIVSQGNLIKRLQDENDRYKKIIDKVIA